MDIKNKTENMHAAGLGETIREGLLQPFKWHYLTAAPNEHSSHPGPGLEKEPFASATATPAISVTQGTQLSDSVGTSLSIPEEFSQGS
jgi:hypothetical protein